MGAQSLNRNVLIILIFIAFCTATVHAQSGGEEYPAWVKQWRTWAKQQEDPSFMEWAERLSSPEAIQLGKEWEEFLGYNAVDLVAKDTKAPHIQPGLVITPDNVVTCPIANGPFCKDKVAFEEVTSMTIVFETAGSNIKVPPVT